MKTRPHVKLVHEGEYVAEVDVSLIESDTGWAPYLSLDDAYKLDDVRKDLRPMLRSFELPTTPRLRRTSRRAGYQTMDHRPKGN